MTNEPMSAGDRPTYTRTDLTRIIALAHKAEFGTKPPRERFPAYDQWTRTDVTDILAPYTPESREAALTQFQKENQPPSTSNADAYQGIFSGISALAGVAVAGAIIYQFLPK